MITNNPNSGMRVRLAAGIGVCILLLAGLYLPAQTQTQSLPAGQILEKVPCIDIPSQSYALYLPSGYSPDRKWPVIYAFDAAARGLLPVRRFKAGAEKYGYILVGSNNARNGPIDLAEEALNALVSDTELRFTLDDRRVYMTGFSGGARVAVAAAAAMKGKVAGVIGCGAGFHSEIPLSAAKSFAFFGAIGTVDFNFPELRALDDDLEKLGVEHRLEVFQGGHEWPPEDVCTHAIEWLELQAMKSGLRKPDPTFIDAQYSSAEERARRYRDKQDLYEAFLAYSSLARDFAGLKDTGTDKINSLELQKSKDVIKAMKREKATIENQKRLENEIFALLDGAMEGGERAFRRQDLIREFINLREQADQTGNETEHLTAARVLSLFWMRLNEDAASDLQNKNLGNAALRLELMARIRPENAQVHYRLSRIYALSGHKKDALGALRTAVAKGFNDAAEMETNPDFETLRMNPDFIRILDSLKK